VAAMRSPNREINKLNLVGERTNKNQGESMQPITVFASAPCAAFVYNLHADDVEWVGVIADAAQTVLFAKAKQADVLLVDARFFLTGATAFMLALHSASPHTKVLLLHDNLDHAALIDAIETGVKGCLPINSPVEDCLKAIRAVHEGDIWLGRRDMAKLLDNLIHKLHPSHANEEDLPHYLSVREREIAAHMSNGLSNKEIAQHLGISDLTVKTHLKHIFHKLKISRRHQLGINPLPQSRS
jgi:DNA-binding NarL/FixJ family response regulator